MESPRFALRYARAMRQTITTRARLTLAFGTLFSISMRVNASLARMAIRDLEMKGYIKKISTHNSQLIYTRATKEEDAPAAAEAPKAAAKGGKKAKAEAAADEE